MTQDGGGLSSSLVARALTPPTRLAPLSALAAELRRPGIWVALCRVAATRAPDWLQARIAADDQLVELLGAQSSRPERDSERARAVCELALANCGRIAEAPSLKRAAAAISEDDPAGDFANLEASANPLLADLLADLRGERSIRRVGRARTVVVDERGRATTGWAAAAAVDGRAPGVRADITLRLFASDDELALTSIVLKERSKHAVLVRLEDDDGWPASGDAGQLAVLVATWSANGRPELGEDLVLGALSDSGDTLVPGRTPPWADVAALLRDESPRGRVLAPRAIDGRNAEVVTNIAALRRAVGRRRRHRRAAALASALVVAAAISALLLGGGTDDTRRADRQAAQAENLLAVNPGAAALRAAAALRLKRDDATVHAALAVTAQARLIMAVGHERGRLVAVAVDDNGIATTVSNAGRATRWRLRGDAARPFSSVRISRDADLLAMSRAGRWLLLSTDRTETGLLVDAAGRVPTRAVPVPPQPDDDDEPAVALAVSDGPEPSIATAADPRGLVLDRGNDQRRIELPEPATALGFSPNGRLLAVAFASGQQIVLDGHTGAELRGPRIDFEPTPLRGPIHRIDIDDRMTTLTQITFSLGGRTAGPAWKIRTRTASGSGSSALGDPDLPITLGGRTLALTPQNNELEIRLERPVGDGPVAVAQTIPMPLDPTSTRPVGSAPRLGLAIFASPAGRFTIVDLRRIIVPDRHVLPSSIAVAAGSVSAVTVAPAGAAGLRRWSLLTPGEPAAPAAAPFQPIGAEVSADGRRVVVSRKGQVVVIDLASGRTIASAAAPHGVAWGPAALDARGTTAAAFNQNDGRVTVWRLGPGNSMRVLRRSTPTPRIQASHPEPIALSSGGSQLVHGNARRLLMTDVGSGKSRPLELPAVGEIIRTRFGYDDALAVAGTGGVVLVDAGEWRSARRLTNQHTLDAQPVEHGVLTASADGMKLRTPTGPDIVVAESRDRTGGAPGTLDAPGAPASIVPSVGDAPLVVLRSPGLSLRRLCSLGGRALAGNHCGPRPRLPMPRSAPDTTASVRAAVLTASGLGPVRLGSRLRGELARVPGYRSGACAVRVIPNLAAAVVTRAGRVEAIGTFAAPYISDDADFTTDAEVMTDVGALTPSGFVAGDTEYGPPVHRDSTGAWWRLRSARGDTSRLRIATDDQEPAITLSTPGARCDVWR